MTTSEAGPFPRQASLDSRSAAERAVRRACEYLAGYQTEAGSWAGDYGGPMFLLPMYVIVAHFADHAIAAPARAKMLRYLLHAQNADGSVGVYEGGPGCVFTSSLTYTAMRLLGASADDPGPSRLAAWVRAHGSPLASAPWGKFALALIDLYDYDGLDPVSPELWLLPYALPFHPGRMWCHARQVYLPMAWLYGHRARRPANELVRAIRRELYGADYAGIPWRTHRGTIAAGDEYTPASGLLRVVNTLLGSYESVAPRWLRTRALDETFEHIAYEDRVTDFLRIGPVNAVFNTAVHAARNPGGAAVEKSFAALEQYLWEAPEGVKMQGYNSSQLWDTAFALQSVLAAPCAREFRPMLTRAHGYIRDNQILDDVPEARRYYRHRSRGGWPFSNRAHGWPITDCTAEGLRCALLLERDVDRAVDESLLVAAVELLLSFQNADGAWGTYERQRAGAWLEALNPSRVFGDIMVDHSFTECTGSVMQALAAARRRFPRRFERPVARAMRRGERFLREKQGRDGGWEGSWGVCFTYGTWFAVSGLRAAGADARDPAVRRACEFLLARQNADGSWGERPESCWRRTYVAHEEGQAVMTAWALSTLVRAGNPDRAAAERAARFLVQRQERDGSWARESIAGVFNRTCMINYDNYRLYFPLWALGEWLRVQRPPSEP